MKPNLRSALNHLTFPVVVSAVVMKRADDLDEARSGEEGAKAAADEIARAEITEEKRMVKLLMNLNLMLLQMKTNRCERCCAADSR
mmetsp:Transcript_8415/g.15316  ORF Transcript_8415/g.15316 Transcript_8415/m.15316 type:complete len:86 (+) Transcript_8415:348-605(+)